MLNFLLRSRYFSMDEEDEDARGLRIAGELAREILRDEDEEI